MPLQRQRSRKAPAGGAAARDALDLPPMDLDNLPPGWPAGLRVLVVDDDTLCLVVVEKMLAKCKYKVTTTSNSKEAIDILRTRPDDFDVVLSDVYMPDINGFKLLEIIGLEMDIPVIMMSSAGDTQIVMEGITHGAVDYLLKPVRIEELRNIWQHVVRRHQNQQRKITGEEEGGGSRRRDRDRDAPSNKKQRVVWNVELHQKFVNAVNALGIDKAVPKRILDLMRVQGLTRENVASHLQKYRLALVGGPGQAGVGGTFMRAGGPVGDAAGLGGPSLGGDAVGGGAMQMQSGGGMSGSNPQLWGHTGSFNSNGSGQQPGAPLDRMGPGVTEAPNPFGGMGGQGAGPVPGGHNPFATEPPAADMQLPGPGWGGAVNQHDVATAAAAQGTSPRTDNDMFSMLLDGAGPTGGVANNQGSFSNGVNNSMQGGGLPGTSQGF
eukprot:PRCOL_00002898-RA